MPRSPAATDRIPDWVRWTGLGLCAVGGVLAFAAGSALGLAGGAVTVLGVAGVFHAAREQRRAHRIGDAVVSALEQLSGGVFDIGDTAALRVDDGFGPAAEAWNGLVSLRGDEAASLEDAAAERALTADAGGAGGGDVLDLLPAGVLVVGAGGRIDQANKAAGVFLRSTPDELRGTGVDAVGLEDDVVAAIEQMRTGAGRRASVEVREENEAGGAPTALRFECRRASRGEGGSVVVVIDDVTQQRLADESRATLLSSAAHELRTPLTNIRLWIEEFNDAPADDDATRGEAINVIGQESRRLERIVGDVLSVGELESGSMRMKSGDVRLGQLFEEIETDYRAQAAEKGVELVFDLPPRMPIIDGDRDRFEQVLHNLVGNGLKYTPEGGKVEVSLDEGDRDVVITVRDTGIGIGEGEIERVFERFYRSTDERIEGVQGTGLGLSIAREIVRRHGGDLTLESELNNGSVFTVRVPAVRRARAA